MSSLDILSGIPSMDRIVYGYDYSDKPNNHCNWEQVLPTTNSRYAWVESDEHFRGRVIAKQEIEND